MLKNSLKSNKNLETISVIFIIIFVAGFILSNFVAGFILPVYILTMGIAFLISLLFPRSGLFALTFLVIIFERFFTLATVVIGRGEYKIYPIDLILLAVFTGLIIQALSKKIELARLGKGGYLLLIFIFLNIIYFFFSIFVMENNLELAFSTLKNYAFYPLVYFAALNLIGRYEDLKRFFNFFLAGAIGVVGFIIFGAINGEGLWTQFTPLSTEGVRILAFPHGLYISLAFITTLVYLIFYKPIGKFLYWLMAVWAVGIIGTMMRHIWIAVFFSIFLVYFLISRESRKKMTTLLMKYGWIMACFLIFIFYAMFISPNSKIYYTIEKTTKAVAQRGASIGNAPADESFAWRELVWSAAYKEFRDDPIFGIGTGKKVYVERNDYRDYVEVRNIHNSYLSILIQLGILGLGIFLLFIFFQIKKLIQEILNNKKDFYAVSALGVVALLLMSLNFQPYLETNLLSVFFWISLGIAGKLTE